MQREIWEFLLKHGGFALHWPPTCEKVTCYWLPAVKYISAVLQQRMLREPGWPPVACKLALILLMYSVRLAATLLPFSCGRLLNGRKYSILRVAAQSEGNFSVTGCRTLVQIWLSWTQDHLFTAKPPVFKCMHWDQGAQQHRCRLEQSLEWVLLN